MLHAACCMPGDAQVLGLQASNWVASARHGCCVTDDVGSCQLKQALELCGRV